MPVTIHNGQLVTVYPSANVCSTPSPIVLTLNLPPKIASPTDILLFSEAVRRCSNSPNLKSYNYWLADQGFMMTRLPDGCSVEWTKQPKRQDRLLTWLENNSVERHCLFNKKEGLHLTKATCVNMAAQAIFAQDENPANSAAVKKNPQPFGSAIMSLFRVQWRPKYRKVNDAIGRDAARLPYDEFEPNSNAKKIAEVEMLKFPYWARLHKFWQLLPEYNQFADKGESSCKTSGGKKRKKTRTADNSSDECGSSSDVSDYKSPQRSIRPQHREGKHEPPKHDTKRMKRSTKKPKLVKSENDAPVPIEVEDSDEPDSSRASTSATTAFFTRDQQFEKEMAELRLKTKEQELKLKEQELKTLEKNMKHEAFMALYGPSKV